MNREIRNITFIGFAASLLYTLFADDFKNPAPPINAVLIGTVGGFIAGVLEVRVFAPGRQRKSFSMLLLQRIITYFFILTLLIILVKASVDSFFLGVNFSEYIAGNTFNEFLFVGEFRNILLYSFAIIAVIIFFRQLNRYLGKGVLLNLILGKYHHAHTETRVFLLIDLQGSTTIAEQLDEVIYYNFLNRFFTDISLASGPYKPAVYRYVGDQITFTWKLKKENLIHVADTFFAMKKRLKQLAPEYVLMFGFFPSFKGTAHVGDVITGEIGDLLSQIVFQGSTLLEATAMEKCSGRNYDWLCVSEKLLEMLPGIAPEHIKQLEPVTLSESRLLELVEIANPNNEKD